MKKYLFFLLLSISHIFAQEFTKESWNIEFSEFYGKNLSTINQVLLTSLPEYLKNNIDISHDHYISPMENIDLLKYLRDEQIDKLERALLQKIEARDTLFFTKESTRKDYKTAETEVLKIKDDINNYRKIDITKLQGFNRLPIKYSSEDIKPYNEMDSLQLKNYMEKNKLDYVVTGSLEEISGNLILEVVIYSKYRSQPVKVYSGIGSNEDILSYRGEIVDSLTRILISENIEVVTIEAAPSDSLIYINSDFKGLGSYSGYYLEGEDLKIRIVKEGYKDLSDRTKVDFNRRVISYSLDKLEIKSILLDSIPRGATVYYGSMYMGVTPLDIPVYSYSQKLTLTYDGYMEKSIVIKPKNRDMVVSLNPGIMDREENFIIKKNQFYTATAVFSFSLAAPLYIAAEEDNADSVIYNIALGNAVFWGGHLFYRLYKYLRAAQLSVE